MKKFLFSFIAILFGIACYSQTPVPPGPISGTWTEGGSPYLIQGETTIEDGTTLTIEPKVRIEFQGSYTMWVYGQILAQGTETDSIIFTATDPLTGWKGVRFDSTLVTNDTSRFVYCVFEYSKAYGVCPDNCGGAIAAINYSKISVNHCLFANNKAEQVNVQDPGGGAIALWTSSPVIRNSTFINNASVSGGAIICWKESNARIKNNLFTDNTAENGGAIFCHDSDPTIKYNIFYENTATVGGGAIFLWIDGSPTIINNTIVDNNSYGWGGGICLYGESLTQIKNTILWGNTAVSGNQVYIWDCVPDFFYCDIQGGQGGFGGVPHTGKYEQCIDDDPLFITVGNCDYHLDTIVPSPCIDEGDPTILDPDGTVSDMGAFYWHQTSQGISDIRYQNSDIRIECRPNPTNGKSDIRYQISEIRSVILAVYDIHGKEICMLVNKTQAAGAYTVSFDASDLPAGSYIVRLQAGNESATEKIFVVR